MAIEIFNRYEHKYKMDMDAFHKVLEVMDEHMELDKHCANHSLYTIANIYYDTPDNTLIRESLSKPVYKEKMRLRSYGVPGMNTKVFLEIKKKFNGLVNKRRTTLKLDEAYDFIKSGISPEIKDYMNAQVVHELEYFMQRYSLSPKVYIAYDRLAYFEKGNDDLRISFDTNIRTRRHDVALENGDYGTKLISDDIRLMEIKTSSAMPLWLCKMLSDLNLRKTSFSKYGTEYQNMLRSETNKTYYFIMTKPSYLNSI
ncbi:MAG: polyphosphate polymerase domain-containing protein [bacterium]|nr:polyphosphate polymerase domain-containing protein [bacterium]